MAKTRIPIWLVPILAIIGLIVVGVPGMWVYMKTTATTLHPDPQTAPAVTHATPPPKWGEPVEQARQLARAHLAEKNLPGLSVAVGVGEELVWAEGFGFADLDSRTPVTPTHRFRIGTASKVLTSAAVGRLLEQGRLNLDHPIQTYVPTFPQKPWPVTLRQLMGHVAGVRNDGGDESSLYGQHCKGALEALREFAGQDLLFQPGSEFRYSNYGWILVSAAAEAAAGKPFLTLMQEQVFDPAGMRDTMADASTTPNRAASYFPRFAADPKYGLHPMRDIDLSCYAGASVFLSTPSDLARFGMAVQNGRLLKAETVQLLQTSQRLTSGKETGYGLGWDLETVMLSGESARVTGHDGDALGGMVASLVTLPERGIVVAVTSNISYADTYSLAVKLAKVFAEPERLAG